MDLPSKFRRAICGLIFVSLVAGCQMQVEPVAPERRPSVKKDPCADRLHDLCGRLLMYHSEHKRLPQSLEQLAAASSDSALPAACPVSGLPYVYRSRGVPVPGQRGLLIAHDAAACHSGMRWGVLADEAGSPRLLTVRVILLPEPTFQAAVDR